MDSSPDHNSSVNRVLDEEEVWKAIDKSVVHVTEGGGGEIQIESFDREANHVAPSLTEDCFIVLR